MKYSIKDAISYLKPKAEWALYGNVYSGLKWLDSNQTQPTESEVNAKVVELNNAEPMRLLRLERDILLKETDWVVIKAEETGVAETDEWKTYRQALRDITLKASPKLDSLYNLDMSSVTFPTKPS
tara:strand:- start:1040 stop:1414 length:375 start_codon:yes stop_codon:yes gene_type:complete